MVEVDKGKINKSKSKKNKRLPDIDLKSLIIGAVVFLFFPVVAYNKGLDLFTMFAAIGPLYIGYRAKTKLKAAILGFIAAIPLLYAATMGALGPIGAGVTTVSQFNEILIGICIFILGLGALISVLGAYLYQSRSKARAEYEAKKGESAKNKPIKDKKEKPKKKKLEDTGSVSQNIVNMFKPRR